MEAVMCMDGLAKTKKKKGAQVVRPYEVR